jgi:alpha-glucoside transport system substrate-binding protein
MAKYKERPLRARQLGTVGGKTVGVFIKAAVKGLIWFSPKLHDHRPRRQELGRPRQPAAANKGNAEAIWCIGLESGAASGWLGTDWIEDIVLAPLAKYDQWWSGKLKWSSPEIKAAFQEFGKVVTDAYGGSSTVLTTNFEKGGDPLFKSPPGCEFHHQASFITGLGAFKAAKSGTDYNFFPFPDIDPKYTGAIEGAGDLFGMFHDTPEAKSLIKYLVTAPAQDIWVRSVARFRPARTRPSYPDDIAKRSAALLTNAKIFAFDASDLMPSAMNNAFLTAILDYTKDPSSSTRSCPASTRSRPTPYRPLSLSASGWPAAPGLKHSARATRRRWIETLHSGHRGGGVPAVLVGYIYATELGLRSPRPSGGPDPAPFWLAPALLPADHLPDPADDRTIIQKLPEHGRHGFRRARQLRLVLRQRDALIASEQHSALWVIFSRGLRRPLAYDPRSSLIGSIRVDRKVRHLRAARDHAWSPPA